MALIAVLHEVHTPWYAHNSLSASYTRSIAVPGLAGGREPGSTPGDAPSVLSAETGVPGGDSDGDNDSGFSLV